MIREFFHFLFRWNERNGDSLTTPVPGTPSPKRIYQLKKAKHPSHTQSNGTDDFPKKIFKLFAYTTSISMVCSVMGLLIFPFIFPEKAAPSQFLQIFLVTSGYLGGAFTSFWKSEYKK